MRPAELNQAACVQGMCTVWRPSRTDMPELEVRLLRARSHLRCPMCLREHQNSQSVVCQAPFDPAAATCLCLQVRTDVIVRAVDPRKAVAVFLDVIQARASVLDRVTHREGSHLKPSRSSITSRCG